MTNKKVIRIISFTLCVLICALVLFGCSEEKRKVTYSEDIADVADFKCVCSTDGEIEFVVENDEAKELYTYIVEQRETAEETEIDRTEQDCIYLSFQVGEPLLILSKKPKANISDALAAESKYNFYGVFWIKENDYMVYNTVPTAAAELQQYYKMPEGTYKRISEMVAK